MQFSTISYLRNEKLCEIRASQRAEQKTLNQKKNTQYRMRIQNQYQKNKTERYVFAWNKNVEQITQKKLKYQIVSIDLQAEENAKKASPWANWKP